MHRLQASLSGAFLALSLVSPVRGDSLDAEAKLKQDQSDCRRWAAQHTHFDPRDTASSDAPRKSPMDPLPRLSTGVASHASPASKLHDDVERQRDALKARKQREQDEADLEARRVAYERAVKNCIEGRGGSVDSHAASIGEPWVSSKGPAR